MPEPVDIATSTTIVTDPPASPAAPVAPVAPTPGAPEGDKPTERPRVMTHDLPPEALTKRLEAERKKAGEEARAAYLKELRDLGIEDPKTYAEAKKRADAELKKFQDAQEKLRRSQMSEIERIKADFATIQKERDELANRLKAAEDDRVSGHQEAVVQRVATKYIDPDMYAYASWELKKHVRELLVSDPAKVEAMDEREIERFFKDLAKRNARFAIVSQAPEPEKRAITNSAGPKKGAPAPAAQPNGADTVAGKSFRPGQQNSMSKQEVKAALKQQGLRGW